MPVVGIRIQVTIGTGKFCIIGAVGMAITALLPLTQVFPAVNREIGSVVLQIFRRHPAGVGGMTQLAISREMRIGVTGRLGIVVIRLVTSHTGVGRLSILAGGMALFAIRNIMPFGQGEKIVIDFIGSPVRCIYIMTINTFGGKTGQLVVGVGTGLVILQVAVHALITNRTEHQRRSAGVALHTIGFFVGSYQREAVLNVQISNIIYNPVGSGVAPGAIISNSLLVHILVAGNTI